MRQVFFILMFIIVMAASCSASISIGCCYENVSVWKYWQMEAGVLREKMLIFNRDSIPSTIQITVMKIEINGQYANFEKDSSFGVVGGPWEIPASQYILVNSPQLSSADSNIHYFYVEKVLKDTLIECGFIALYNYKPVVISDKTNFYSSLSVDGEAWNNGFWWEYDSFIAESGQEATIHVKVADKNWGEKCKLKEILVLNWPDSLSQNNIFPLNVRSENLNNNFEYSRDILNLWHPSLEYMLSCEVPAGTNTSEATQPYSLEIDIVAPKVEKPEIITVNILINCGPCTNSYFLPLIVHPATDKSKI